MILDQIPDPVPASRAVAIDEPFAPRPSWWSRFVAWLAPVIPDGHPDGLGSLDRLERGSAEFGGPVKHDGWPPATPDWVDLTREQQDEHRDWCAPSTGGPCKVCEDHREFGGCPSCERPDAEIIGGTTRCCDAPGLQGDAFEAWWNA